MVMIKGVSEAGPVHQEGTLACEEGAGFISFTGKDLFPKKILTNP